MPTLVLCDDYWHPARTPRAGLAPLAERGFTFDWLENGRAGAAEKMNSYPTIILTKANHTTATNQQPWLNEHVAAAFVDYVRRGGGLLVIHSGAAGYEDVPLLRNLLGGIFDHHPPQCPVMLQPQPHHPLTTGSHPFTITDEHYFMHFDDDQADIFLTTTSAHGTQPGGWSRTEGAGRVCVLTPGHNLEVWLHPVYQNLIKNALHWCGNPPHT
ncbi:MAG: ThuA domain-containing protein [Anaerolineae bacterium]|nr:ThuA domain-containing protein [Anaerolineae bacterium]